MSPGLAWLVTHWNWRAVPNAKSNSTGPACRCWTACAPETVNAVMAIFTHHGFVDAVDIGEITTQTGEPKLVVN
jgi:hypothetical protein